MTRLLPLLAAAALLAWLWRQLRGAAGSQTAPPRSQPGDPAWDEDEDGVQPADPLTRMLLEDAERDRQLVAEWDQTLPHVVWQVPLPPAPVWGEAPRYGTGDFWPPTLNTNTSNGTTKSTVAGYHDPTYIEAREVAIRRGGQSSERTTGGM